MTSTHETTGDRSPRRRLGGRLAVAAGLAAGLAVGWLLLPRLLYGREAQPLDFNHVLHTDDAGLACQDCHRLRDDGSFAGLPDLAGCADCHTETQGDSPDEQRLVDDYVSTGRPIPWLVSSRQPQNVYFSHAAHVKLAAIACSRCHGDIGASTSLPVYEYNRISTYSRRIWGPRIAGGGPRESDSMKMSDCTDCHARRGVADHCLMCHK
ncbi:MAG: menaquinone reductase multiheme cytochrome c subunit QrcA [Candidatus Krumholzibacteriia bacterium]